MYIENKLRLQKQKQQALRNGSGIWANRDDLPDFNNLRKEFNRENGDHPARLPLHPIL